MSNTFETPKMIALALGIAIALPMVAVAAPHGSRIDFETLDADGNGEVTQAEITAQAEARFAEADTNGDGNLSAEELTARADAKSQERMERRIAKMIERRDANGDGVLSADEMRPDAERAGRFDKLDADDNGSISKEEFETAMARHGGKRKGHRGHKNKSE